MEAQVADGVRVRLLGGFEASSGERQVPPSGWRLRKAKSLVKLLALAPARTIHVEQAADSLWPDLDGPAARNNLHQALYVARRALATLGIEGPAVITLHDDLLTLGRDVVVDIDELRAAVKDAVVMGDDERVVALLEAAPAELLPEDAYEPWLQPYAAAFREWRTQAVLDVATRQIDSGAAQRAVVLLTPVTAADPMNEPAVRTLMRALEASGRRSEALVLYERTRSSLQEELGADPEPETRMLFRELLTASAAPTASRLTLQIPSQRSASNLPAPLSALVGRSRELDEVKAALTRTRLLTLTGMGGVGKTSLAIEAARLVADQYADGAHLVDLASVRESDEVVGQLARALRLALPSDSSAVDAVVAQLRSREALVVLDNCEHLLDACAQLVSALLRGCPQLRVVATSREPLRVEGEVSWRTPSLTLPDPSCTDELELGQSASVELFVRRAAASLPGFSLTADNAVAVAAICHRLDGIPLALELAAACVPMLAPEQIAERLGDAIALLRHGDRALTRQQTLEATLTWSHDLLSPDEQLLFRRLSVFAGSFTLQAAEVVAAYNLPADVAMSALARLVDTSLVVVDLCGDETRYRLLDTVRQYAALQLRGSHELHAVERRHCEWFLAYAVARDPERQALTAVAPVTLDVEHDNLRAALDWALRHDPPVGLQLSVSLWRYWLARGFLAEGRRWLERGVDVVPDPSPDRCRALLALAAFDVRRGVADRLEKLGAEAVAIRRSLPDRKALAESLAADAVLAFLRGSWAACLERTTEARELAAETGATAQEVSAIHVQGIVNAAQRRLPEARAAFEEARTMLSWVGNAPLPFLRPVSQGFAIEKPDGEVRVYFEETVLHGRIVGVQQSDAHLLCNLTDVARAAGDLDEALALATRAHTIFAELNDVDGEAVALSRLGCLHRVRGEHTASREALTRCLTLREGSGERRAVSLARTNLALLLAAEGDVDGGRRLIEEQIKRAVDVRDGAGQVAMSVTLASVEADAGNDEAAAAHLRPLLGVLSTMPGGSHAAPWTLLMYAAIVERLGDVAAADAARGDARRQFSTLGIVGGLAAADRATAAKRG